MGGSGHRHEELPPTPPLPAGIVSRPQLSFGMKTQTALFTAKATLLGLLFSLSGCSGSDSEAAKAANGPMYIESCSLGCGNAQGGTSINCSLVNISQNSEITVLFSQAVKLSSVNSSSFRIVNLNNGTVPDGVFTISPANPRLLVFRPSLTFSGSGIPEFGFDPNETYQISIQGSLGTGTGPFIESVAGKVNSTILDCTVQTVAPPIDPVPGSPTVTAYYTSTLAEGTDAVEYGGELNLPVGGQLLSEATDIPLKSKIVLIIDDVMNKSTVANQLTGQSSTITVMRESDSGDPIVQAGRWDVTVDYENLLRTLAVFTPSPDDNFLSAGGDPMNPLRHTLTYNNQLQDVVGNAVSNPGSLEFTAVVTAFAEQVLTEDFTSVTREDLDASGAEWGGGLLTHGTGGGAGRLGPLLLTAGDVLTLNTDSQVFPIPAAPLYPGQLPSILSNEEPLNDPGDPDLYDPNNPSDWPTVTIDTPGQGFEFSEVQIQPGAVLILEGSQPGRIFARGNMVHNGILDLSGETAEAHRSNSGSTKEFNLQSGVATRYGGTGGAAGPNGGAGGDGASRIDVTGLPASMENAGGIIWPVGGPAPFFDGEAGFGVGGAADQGTSDATGGIGGVRWPDVLPQDNFSMSAAFGTAVVSDMGLGENCRVAQVAGPGSGGSHALPGQPGVPMSPFLPTLPADGDNTPDETSGGDNTFLDLEAPGSDANVDNKRNLEFWFSHLNGGSGGGGGGTSLYGSENHLYEGTTNCNGAGNWALNGFFDHSAAAGGGGGGALMLVAGRKLTVGGTIDCSGGGGGSSNGENSSPIECTENGSALEPNPNCGGFAAPGGGGSGGAVRMQADEVSVLASASITVEGGLGGTGAGGSTGGDASPGLVRIEHNSFTNQADEAEIYAPQILPIVANTSDIFNSPFKSAAILSIGDWRPPATMANGFPEYPVFRPEAYSGSQSCWIAAEETAGASGLLFVEDAGMGNTDPELFGWNMDISFLCPDNVTRLFPYRGLPPNDAGDNYDEAYFNSVVLPDLLGGLDFETYLGTTLNHDESVPSLGTYVAVRFQGVQSSASASSLCSLDLQGPLVTPGSLTPFVGRPEYLNEFDTKPNLVRFAVVFDESLKEYDDMEFNLTRRILGVTNLWIRVQPD